MEKISHKKNLWLYALGDTFGGGTSVIIPFFYLIFLTDVVGLEPGYAGLMFLIVRIWDSVSDPLMGHITDNTRGKFGRRRPYFFVGFFGIIISFCLLWSSFDSENQLVLFAYVLFANLLYTTINTIVSVTYNAYGAEISNDAKERDFANGARTVISQLASLVCALVPLEIVNLFASEATGYQVMALVFGVLMAVPFLLMALFTKEVVEVTTERKKVRFKEFYAPFKIKSFRQYVVIFLLTFINMSIVTTLFSYFMKYYLGRYDELTYVLGAMLIAQTISVLPALKMVGKYGKPFTYKVFTVVSILGAVLSIFIVPSDAALYFGPWVLYFVASVIGFGMGACITLVYLMFPDIVEAGELETGERNAGSYSGINSFFRKFSGAIVAYLVTLTMQFTGYINPIKQEVDGVIQNIEQIQPDSYLLALRIMFVVVPIIFCAITYYYATKYKLDNRILKLMKDYLAFSRNELPENPLTEEEEKELKSIL